MAKLTLDDVGNLNTAGLATINENSSRIEAALENTLSRDGTSPNQMEADLDLNHNDIINVDNLDVGGEFIFQGQVVHPDNLVVTDAVLVTDTDASGFDFVIDEDDMASDSATKVPTQQSVKAYADTFGNYSPTFNLTRVRSVQERLSEGIFLDDFNGSTDTDKLLDFAGSGEGHIRLPSKSMTIESGIVIDQDVSPYLEIAGISPENSQIIYTGTDPELFQIKRLGQVNALTSRVGFHVHDLHLVAGSDSIATAIAADLDDAAPSTGGYEGYRRRISRIVMTAQDTGKAWATGIRLNNSSYALADDIFFRSISQKGTAVYITGARDNVSNVIRHLKVVSANKGVYGDSDYTEGTSIFEPDIIATNRAVEFDANVANPQLMISGGHMNILEYAIKTRNITSVIASDLLIYALQAGAIGVSINDEDAAFIRAHSFVNVDIFGNSDAAARGYEFTGSTRTATINGGSVTNFSGGRGVDIASGCLEIYVDPSVQFRSNASNFVSASDTCRVQVLDQTNGELKRRIPTIDDYVAGTQAPLHRVYKSRGTVASPTIVQSGDVLRKDMILAWDGTAYVNAGYSQWSVSTTPGASDMPTRWALAVSNDGVASPQERLIVERNGAIISLPPSVNQGSLLSNGQVTWELTNNTTLTFRAKGSDGTVRSGTVTLA